MRDRGGRKCVREGDGFGSGRGILRGRYGVGGGEIGGDYARYKDRRTMCDIVLCVPDARSGE